MALSTKRENAATYPKYVMVVRSGARTAADFKVEVGFRPIKVLVTNLTDRVSAQWDLISGNAKQLLTIADGTRTYEAAGVAVTAREIAVTVATKGLETDDDVVMVEVWG
jgi:hypothetical protein